MGEDPKLHRADKAGRGAIEIRKTPRALTPRENHGLGLFVDRRVRSSLRRACRVAFPYIANHNIDRSSVKKLWVELLQIIRKYWADRDYDGQPTFGEIKAELRQLEGRLLGMIETFKGVPAAVRRELNTDRMFVHGDRHYTDYVGKAEAAIKELEAAADRISAPEYRKVKSIAVSKCASALAAIWSEATGKKFSKTKRFDRGPTGNEFTSPGARFVQLAMNAIDENVGFEQIHSWLAEKPQAQNGKK